MSLEHLRRVQLIRCALAEGDVAFAARVAFNLEHELVYGFESDDYATEAAESTPAATTAAAEVLTPWNKLDDPMRDARYDALAETMEGPPEFSLVVTGSMESTTYAVFEHAGGENVRRRLLDWLGGSVEGGDVLDRMLMRFPV
jgi:hypothetical protein